MKSKINSIGLTLIILSSVWMGCGKNEPAPVNTDPQLVSVDKSSVINGELITITGKNFAKNYNGASQVLAVNVADTSKRVYLFILSRTSTQLVSVMTGTGGGLPGTYNLSYASKPDASKAKLYPSAITVDITAPDAARFFVSSTFLSNQVNVGAVASFGLRNGTTNSADYTIKLVSYDSGTGLSTDHDAVVIGITANGYGGSMDQLNFTVPGVDAGEYEVKVIYKSSTLIAGWNSLFFVN